MDSGTMRLIETAQARYGWTDTTLLGVLADYIANQDADDALAAYLAERGPETYDEEENEPGDAAAAADTAAAWPEAGSARPTGKDRDQAVITGIQERLGNDRYEIGEATGDLAGERGASFTARGGDCAYVITIRRQELSPAPPGAPAGRRERARHDWPGHPHSLTGDILTWRTTTLRRP